MAEAKSEELYKSAQRLLVGALLYEPLSVERALEIVTPEDFEEPVLEIIFSAFLELARRNDTPSPVGVAQELEKNGLLQKVGGVHELYRLRNEGRKALEEAPPELYAQVVREASAKSKVSEVIKTASDTFKNDSGVPAVEGIASLQTDLNEQLFKLSDEATTTDLAESFTDYLALLEKRKQVAIENEGQSEGLQGIPSLLPSLNRYTTGWLPGQLITVGARTGVGKSVFAVNVAMAAAQAGKSVQFFSLEMERDEIIDRMISSTTGISLNKLKQGDLVEEEKELLGATAGDIKAMKLKIETEARVTIDSIRAKALRQAQTDDGLDLLILDYLQLVTPVGNFSSRQEAVADLSRNAKLLAKQLQIPVIVLVQVNRQGNDDENPVPKLSQIRESGAIAQDSDIVILLHRDDSLDDNIPHTLVLLEKNRNGEAQKTIRCHSNLECSLFREIVRQKDVERMTAADEEAALEDLDMGDFANFDTSDIGDIDDDELFY